MTPHWLDNEPITIESVTQCLEAAEKIGDGGAWTSNVVIWLAKGLLAKLKPETQEELVN